MSTQAIFHRHSENSRRVPGRGIGPSALPESTPIVFVVDNDVAVRRSLKLLIRREGWRPETFASAHAFLGCPRAAVPTCLVLNVSLSDINGLELQKRVALERPDMPIMFIADQVDIPTTVQAMKAGAIEFFTKPLLHDVLVTAMREGIERSRSALGYEAELQPLRDRYASLTCRELQVMTLVVAGLPNKLAGAEIGISEITVKAHRGRVMKKMKANSLADLVKMAARLGLESRSKNQANSLLAMSPSPAQFGTSVPLNSRSFCVNIARGTGQKAGSRRHRRIES
jgi:FixJ family two-component response regulator